MGVLLGTAKTKIHVTATASWQLANSFPLAPPVAAATATTTTTTTATATHTLTTCGLEAAIQALNPKNPQAETQGPQTTEKRDL